MTKTLVVLWTAPVGPVGPDSVVLSFLSPGEEDVLEALPPSVEVVIARREIDTVRKDARELYRRIVADMGVATFDQGRTVRQALKPRDEWASLWWFMDHHEGERVDTYDYLLIVLLVLKTFDEKGATSLRLVGAPLAVAAALRNMDPQGRRAAFALRCRSVFLVCRGLLARVRYTMRWPKYWSRIRTLTANAQSQRVDCVLFASWPWSFSRDESGVLQHRYFLDLPHELRRRGLNSAWEIWLTDSSSPSDGEISELQKGMAIDFPQATIAWGELLRTMGRLSPIMHMRRASRLPEWRRLLNLRGVDLWSLFSEQIWQNLGSALVPHLELVAASTERVCAASRPRFAFEYQEFFPLALAHYEGVRRADPEIKRCAVMHSTYCHETVIALFDRQTDIEGQPDGCPIPKPHVLYAMGELSKAVFVESGLPPESIIVTGAPRYSYLFTAKPGTPPAEDDPSPRPRVLLLASLSENVELDMVEAAVAAHRGLSFRPRLRPHPLSRLLTQERFRKLAPHVDVTTSSLADDIAWADVIVFSYSTAAEEAFVLGKLVWQWMPVRFNGSALTEVSSVRRFGTIGELRAALVELSTSDPHQPDVDWNAVERLFGPGGGAESERIADHCLASGR